jgi:Mg-chelatase subunit ChlD
MGNIIRLDLLVDVQRPNFATPIPAMAVLVIDRSGSMAGDRTQFASSGAWDFSQSALTKGYRVAVIDFATGDKITCAPSRKLTEVQCGCSTDSLTGSTQMHEGLRLASSLEPRSGDTIIVVTDGVVDNPADTLVLGSKLKASGVEILAIGTDDADKEFLSRLASRPDLSIKVQSSHLRQAITDASRLLGTSRR